MLQTQKRALEQYASKSPYLTHFGPEESEADVLRERMKCQTAQRVLKAQLEAQIRVFDTANP
jgi:hypothetical protein